MLKKTRGIVLNFVKFKDTSLIVKIYTEKFGLQSYIENGVRSKNSKNKIALFQPLTLLDLVVYVKENQNIHRINEIKCGYPYVDTPLNYKKTTIAIFINEVLSKLLREEFNDEKTFEFIWSSLINLDLCEENFENFHLQFLIKLTKFLGIGASGDEIFDQTHSPGFRHVPSETIDRLFSFPYDEPIKISNSERREILDILLSFYRLHFENFTELKSLKVLREILI